MTVAELIEELQKLDPELEVYKEYWDDGNGCCGGNTAQEEVDYVSTGVVSLGYMMQPGPRGGKEKLRPHFKDVVVIH